MEPDSLLTLGAIFGLLLFSAFFSGSETALTASSRATMHKLQEDGIAAARQVNRLKERPERLIGAILLGNNLVNIFASALATALFLKLFGDAGVAIATLVMTFVVLIFAEILPKTLAIARTNRLAMVVAAPLGFFVAAFAPVVDVIQVGVRRLVHLFGVDIAAGEDVLSAHERLRGEIELHHQEGEVVKGHRDMLGGILDLAELEVADVMIHRKSMEMIDAGQPNDVIVQEVLKSAHTRLPLWREDPENIIGVLHQKDLLRALSRVGWDASKLDVEEIALKPWFVPETTELNDQLNAFLRERLHFALVVDEYGVLMGLLTLEDILEEIVGDIRDEYDLAVTGVRPQADGSFNVDGSVPIRDLNRALDWNLPDEEATTIAGLVIHEAQTIPEPGQIFAFYGYKFEVLRRHRNQITALRITPPRRRRETAED
jgi:Mg2+/Co2+ transporter CorB